VHPTHLERVERPACGKRRLRYRCSPTQPTTADKTCLLLLLLLHLLGMLLLLPCCVWRGCKKVCSRICCLFLAQRCSLCAHMLPGSGWATSSSLPSWCVEPIGQQRQQQLHTTAEHSGRWGNLRTAERQTVIGPCCWQQASLAGAATATQISIASTHTSLVLQSPWGLVLPVGVRYAALPTRYRVVASHTGSASCILLMIACSIDQMHLQHVRAFQSAAHRQHSCTCCQPLHLPGTSTSIHAI
jgi:hypothetical protein